MALNRNRLRLPVEGMLRDDARHDEGYGNPGWDRDGYVLPLGVHLERERDRMGLLSVFGSGLSGALVCSAEPPGAGC